MSIPIDFSMLSPEKIQEEYLKLFEQLTNVKNSEEHYQQEIFELKRNLKISKSNEEHLNQELENLLSFQNAEINKLQTNHDQGIEDLRKKYKDFEEQNINLMETISKLQNELKMKENLHELRDISHNCNSLDVNTDREIKLEYENLELMKRLDECEDDLQKVTRQNTEKERQIEILNEQLQCAEENLSSKREDLEEKTSLLESAQEQMAQMNAELALLRSSDSNNRKGNSLFAEVDDQRQVMRTLLATQKKSYLEMRKSYNASEHEIRRLKRLNTAMYSELQACTAIFLNAERSYKEKLNDRIIQLLKQNEELEKKLKWSEDQLVIFFKDNGVNWMDSMLAFCKNETHEYKAQVHSTRMQKSVLDYNLYNAQQELSKWRFEALRSRCVLIERESLLEENSIKFQKLSAQDFQFDEEQLKSVTPNIFPNSQKKKKINVDDSQKENQMEKAKSSNSSQIENCSTVSLDVIDVYDSTDSSIIEIEDTVGFQINSGCVLENTKLSDTLPKETDRKIKKELESTDSLIEKKINNSQKSEQNIFNVVCDSGKYSNQIKNELESTDSLIAKKIENNFQKTEQNIFNVACDFEKYSNQSKCKENFCINKSGQKTSLLESQHSESLGTVCEKDFKNNITEYIKLNSPKKESKKIQTEFIGPSYPSTKEQKSILAKPNVIFRQNESKCVQFNESNIKHVKSETDKNKNLMKKSNNVIMKKIVIKSNTGNMDVK